MISFAVSAFFVGSVLGMRWRVFVLLPTSTALALATIAASFFGLKLGFAATALNLLAMLLAHQAGYLVGATIRALLVQQREHPNVVARS
jgi:hypothetical protein